MSTASSEYFLGAEEQQTSNAREIESKRDTYSHFQDELTSEVSDTSSAGSAQRLCIPDQAQTPGYRRPAYFGDEYQAHKKENEAERNA